MDIIVVDDDASQRFYLSATMMKMGHDVVAVSNGQAGLQALEETGAQILICDVQMPDLDGMALARMVRARDWGRYVHVLMVTGLKDNKDRMEGLEAGADDFMSKPIDPAVLMARLKSAQRLIDYEQQLTIKNAMLDAAYSQMRQDMAAAAEAQLALLPPARAHIGEYAIASLFLPSKQISGDVYGYFDLREGRLGVFAADASGHGVRAALSAVAMGHMVSQEFFEEMGWSHQCGMATPERVTSVLDARFGSQSFDDSYFTVLTGVADPNSDQFVFCQAGCPYPILVPATGQAPSLMGDGGSPVGMLPGMHFGRNAVPFHKGDRLAIYSDGITEAADITGEQFGDQRLSHLLNDTRELDPSSVFAELKTVLQDWTGAAVQDDDITLILLDRRS